ncbi:MAG TPA: GTPase [Ignisphaera aggregans]|uniref:GTPase n=1 Tax=Ignisphaera aggregans TaxID=334771 RepID=A0A833DV78_9CREN|nr:GTPase [Ignisphaera aggregans]
MVRRIIIMGAGGRDFHNFNVVFRNNPEYYVVAFTAAQIPGIEFKRYPPSLAGPRYPEGIPIYPEEMLPELITKFKVDEVVLSYSDLTYEELGRKISMVLAAGASFRLLGPNETMIESTKPVIAVTAVKTGAGKSTVSRAVSRELKSRNIRYVVVRHPMAYGDLERMAVQIFRTLEDLDKYGVTIEEREEYEPHLKMGVPVLAGVDYGKVLLEAEKMGDVILWDGGNNDWPFFRPWYMITVADAMRPGMEIRAYPGEVNVRMANAIIITKVSQARAEDVETIVKNVREINPKAHIIKADMEIHVDKPELISGKRVVVIEDSPTVTHGGLPYGAGYVAAKKYGAEIVDPKPYAVGIIKRMFEEYKHIGPVLPSTGYTPDQLRDLEETLRRIDCDVIVLGTPADIAKLIRIDKPVVRVSFELKIVEGPTIKDLVDEFLELARKYRAIGV